MRVLYICNEAGLGGAARSLLDLLVYLLDTDVFPYVVIPENGIIENELKRLGIKYFVVRFQIGQGLKSEIKEGDADYNFFNNYCAALEIDRILKYERIDLVHSNSTTSNVGAFFSIIREVPHIWHVRDFGIDFGIEYWDPELKVELMRRSDGVISISDYIKASIKKYYGVNSERIYNGLNTKYYYSDIPFEKKKKEIVFLGRLDEGKRHIDAIKAIQLLQNKGKTVKLHIVGGNGGRNELFLKKYVEKYNLNDNILFYDFALDTKAFRNEFMYSITASPEALGRTTIEAMLSEQIVLGADVGANTELIGEDERGYCFKYMNAESLANRIEEVQGISLSAKRRVIDKADSYARTVFDPIHYIATLKRVYNKAIREYSYDRGYAESLYRSFSKSDYKAMTYKRSNFGWHRVIENEAPLIEYFRRRNYKRIAIYGIGNNGCKLYLLLEKNGINIDYVMDKNPREIQSVIKVLEPKQAQKVDVVVVSMEKDYEGVVAWLESIISYHIISLADILKESYGLE